MSTHVPPSHWRRLAAVMILGTAACGVMALATAADSDRGSQITVRYGDLDVGSPAGAAILYRRIHSAAGQVCSRLDHGDLASKKNVTACADKAIADAVTQVNQPELFVVYNANHSTPLPASLVSQRLR